MSVIVYVGDYVKTINGPKLVVKIAEFDGTDCVLLSDDSVCAVNELTFEDILLESEVL